MESTSRASIKSISGANASLGNAGIASTPSTKTGNKGFYIGLFIMLLLLGLSCWLAWYFWPTSDTGRSIAGSWSSYNAQGVKSGYDWKITQTSTGLTVVDQNMPTTTSPVVLTGDTVTIPGFKLVGTLTPDSKRINWLKPSTGSTNTSSSNSTSNSSSTSGAATAATAGTAGIAGATGVGTGAATAGAATAGAATAGAATAGAGVAGAGAGGTAQNVPDGTYWLRK
jgi:hypothetical protein